MDRKTYHERSLELIERSIDNTDQKLELLKKKDQIWARHREQPLESDETTLTHEADRLEVDAQLILLEEEQKEIKAERAALEEAIKDGFDKDTFEYIRSGNRDINKLLPPIPDGQKDVIDADLTQPFGVMRSLAIGAAIASVLALLTSFVFFPGIITFGIFRLFNPATTITNLYDSATVSDAIVYIAWGVVFYVVSFLRRPWHSVPTETFKRFLLGSQSWSIGQCARSILVYAFTNILVLIAPVAFVSFRIVYIGLATVVYRTKYRRSHDTSLAYVTAWRFTDIFGRMFTGIMGVMIMIVGVLLLS